MAEYKLEEKLFEQTGQINADGDSESEKTLREMICGVHPDGCNSMNAEPFFSNDVMYIVSADHNVYAIDTKTAKILWKFKTNGPILHSPVVYENTLYVGSYDNNLYAVDIRNGTELWHFRTGDKILIQPLVLADCVIFGSFDRNIYALTHSGEQLWKTRLGGFTIGEITYIDGKIFVGGWDGRLYALANDGKILWSYYAGNTAAGCATYIKETNSIIFATWGGYLYNLTLDGRLLWKTVCEGTIQPRYHFETHFGTIYVGSGDTHSGALWAIDAKTGKSIWKYPTFGRIQEPRILGDMILGAALDKNLYTVGKDGRLLWKFHADGCLNAPPAHLHGLIYQPSWSGHLYCLDENGQLVWKMFFPGRPMNDRQVLSGIQKVANTMRALLTFWKPEKPVPKAYETTAATPQLSLGPAAYKMSEPYKSEVGYKSSAPVGYEMKREKKKDWRDPFAR